ncbi:MAG TPA: hemolysin family protein [Acidothermaceae bacterium]|nr:hemolysin family protein [Acidothermaceae bacterium]
MSVGLNVLVVLALILVEAIFVATEISLVSLRDSQVKGLAAKGRRGAAVAHLTADPNRFLAAVQIGVTLTSLLSSAYGAVTLSHATADGLVSLGMARGAASVLGFLLVTIVISFVTLVIGELAPKRLALQRAEAAAQLAAPALDRFAGLMRPVIWLLSLSTNLVVRFLGGDPGATRESISEEELRGLVSSHEALGRDERRLIDEVFTASDRRLREVLVPRTEVQFLDAGTTVAQAWRAVKAGPHSRYPVVRGSHDDVVGFVHIRDLFAPSAEGDARSIRVGDLARPVMLLPDGKNVLAALAEMRRERLHLAIVVDEYGGTAGIVTLEDLVEEVVGDIRDEYDVETNAAQRLGGGDVVVDGLLNTDDFAEESGVELPEGPYETVAGYVMAELGHVPQIGEAVDVAGYRLTVDELDGRRVARVRISRTGPGVPEAGERSEAAQAAGADGLEQ